jgi:hypothetical protein
MTADANGVTVLDRPIEPIENANFADCGASPSEGPTLLVDASEATLVFSSTMLLPH